MITLPTYNSQLTFKQFIKNYFNFKITAENTRPASTKKATDLKRASFLVISDDPFTSFVFGRFIEKWNGIADIASSEEQALENLSDKNYKGILIDIKSTLEEEETKLSATLLTAINQQSNAYTVALVDEKTDALKSVLVKAGIKDWVEKEIQPGDLSEKLVFYTR